MVDLFTTNKQFLRVDEAVEILETPGRTVYRWCATGQLQAVRIGGSWRISVHGLRARLQPVAPPVVSGTPFSPQVL